MKIRYFDAFAGYGGFSLGIQRATKKVRRELLCELCDEEYHIWFTKNEHWNSICGIDGKNIGNISFLCPNCFIKMSESQGIGGIWEIKLEKYDNLRPIQQKSSKRPKEQLKFKNKLQQWECVGYSEIDKYAVQIYSKHFPTHKPYGDITNINASELPDFDLFVGGFPCQAFSIAGKRGGFEDTRGTLIYDVLRIVKEKHPKLVLLENVKGLLSHDHGRTFKTIITALAELGYAVEWQVLNAKNFGVPQNRERVFIIGHLRGFGGRQVFPIIGSDREVTKSNGVIPVLTPDRPEKRQNGRRFKEDGDPSFTLTGQDKHGIYDGMKIRRLTPTECERLMGLPDGWTEGVSDTQRYKLCGNGVVVNVVEEIVKRLL